jgi:hypothetical protein
MGWVKHLSFRTGWRVLQSSCRIGKARSSVNSKGLCLPGRGSKEGGDLEACFYGGGLGK